MPLDIIDNHAEEDMRKHPFRPETEDWLDFEINGLVYSERIDRNSNFNST